MGLLPSCPDTSAADEANPQVVGVDSDRADALMAALSSETAREILTALHEEPGAPSNLADRVGTSLQNIQYHLGRLEEAGVVEIIDTVYSEKGREMDIYAPADRPLVIFAGQEEQSRTLRDALSSVLTGVTAVALGAIVIQELFGRSFTTLLGAPRATQEPDGGHSAAEGTPTVTPTGTSDTAEGGAQVATPTPSGATAEATGTPTVQAEATGTPMPSPTAVATDTATAAARTATETVSAAGGIDLPPGLLFFLGGVIAVAVVVLVLYR